MIARESRCVNALIEWQGRSMDPDRGRGRVVNSRHPGVGIGRYDAEVSEEAS
jgi:hypothetical protein